MIAPVPDYTLETGRLVLRVPEESDFAAYFAMWCDMRLGLRAVPMSEEDAWLRFVRNIGQWQMRGCGYWSVIERETGLYAGAIGFVHARRPIDFPGRDAPEIGWALVANRHGLGYGSESVGAAVAWADAALDDPMTWCLINPDNAVSLALANRMGYGQMLRTDYKDRPAVVLTRQRLSSDHEPARS